jgi:hypothetical protein
VAIISNEIRKSNGGTLGSAVGVSTPTILTNFLTITGNDIYDWISDYMLWDLPGFRCQRDDHLREQFLYGIWGNPNR